MKQRHPRENGVYGQEWDVSHIKGLLFTSYQRGTLAPPARVMPSSPLTCSSKTRKTGFEAKMIFLNYDFLPF